MLINKNSMTEITIVENTINENTIEKTIQKTMETTDDKLKNDTETVIKKQLIENAKLCKLELFISSTPYVCDFLNSCNIPWLYFDANNNNRWNQCRIWIPDYKPPHFYMFDKRTNGDYSNFFTNSIHTLFKQNSLELLNQQILKANSFSIDIKSDSYRLDFLNNNNVPYMILNENLTDKNEIRIWLSKTPCPYYYRFTTNSENIITIPTSNLTNNQTNIPTTTILEDYNK